MKILVPFLFCKTEEEFRTHFKKEFLRGEIKYKGVIVTFAEEDFNHICFERGKEGKEKGKFGQRRARRLLAVKEMLLEVIPAELRFEDETGHYCLLCEELDMVVFLVPVNKNKTLQMGTIIHLGEGFTKAIEKQKKKSRSVRGIIFKK